MMRDQRGLSDSSRGKATILMLKHLLNMLFYMLKSSQGCGPSDTGIEGLAGMAGKTQALP